jgi:hypothetical protein
MKTDEVKKASNDAKRETSYLLKEKRGQNEVRK